jgi:hypothetical protein
MLVDWLLVDGLHLVVTMLVNLSMVVVTGFREVVAVLQEAAKGVF